MSGDGSRGVLENLYENFIARDLTFIFGGGVVSASFLFLIDSCPPNLLKSVTENIVYIIIFIITSYFIGVFCHELFYRCNIIKAIQTEINGRDVMFIESEAQKKGMGFILRRIERLIYIKQIFGVMGSCMLLSSSMFCVKLLFDGYLYFIKAKMNIFALFVYSFKLWNNKEIFLYFGLIIIGAACARLNYLKWNRLNRRYGILNNILNNNN